MDVNGKKVAEMEQNIDVDAWIQGFIPNSNQVDGNAETEGRTKFSVFDADYVSLQNVSGCSNDKSSSQAETKADFIPGLLWNSKPMNCDSGPQQARTSETPVQISPLESKPLRSHDPYNIVESSIHLENSLKPYGSQVSKSLMPQQNQLQHLLMQISQQPNNQSFPMQSSAQNSNQIEQWPIQLNKVQYSQLHSSPWVGNNTSMLQKGTQATPSNNIAGKWQHLQAFQHDMVSSWPQPQHTSGYQSRFSSSQAHPCPLDISHPTTAHKDFLHLRSSQNQIEGSNQIMPTSSLLNSRSPTLGFSQKPIGNSQGKLARGSSDPSKTVHSSGSTSSIPQNKLTNSTEWSDHAYEQLQAMKDTYLAEVIKLYKKAQESCLKSPNAELSINNEKKRVLMEKIIMFLQMSKEGFIQFSKEKVCHYMNFITNYLDQERMKNSAVLQKNSAALQKHLEQLQVPKTPPIMRRTGNGKFQFNQSTLGSSSSIRQSSSHQELSHLKASCLLNSSGEVSIKAAETSSKSSIPDSSKRPMHPYAISWQQNANISSSHSDQEQRCLRLPGLVAILDNSTLSNRDHATSLPANTVNAFASASTLSQKTKQPMGLANTGNVLGSPMTQLQKIMQLEGQTVTKISNEVNESKVKHMVGSNAQMLQNNKHSGHLRQISPSNSSQLHPASSPQNSQHSFPPSAISPSIVPSPLTPLTPSSLPESPQRVSSSLGLSLFAEGIKSPKINMPSVMKRTHSEDNHLPKRPIKRLIDAIGSVSEESLCASVCDIGNVVNIIDTRGGTLCYGDFRGSIGDDLMGDVRCFLRKAKLCRNGTIMDDKNINVTTSKATSIIKCPNSELKTTVLEEIKETNRKLVETLVEMVVDGSDEEVHRLRAEENIIIRCSYSPVGFCENTLQQCTSSGLMFPEMLVLQLLVLGNYPKASPIVLDKSPDLFSDSTEEVKYGYKEVKLRFDLSLRQLSEPMSIREMAKTWDICARQVFAEFAERMGGGSFSSVYGVWEKCNATAT